MQRRWWETKAQGQATPLILVEHLKYWRVESPGASADDPRLRDAHRRHCYTSTED